jgi:hypothetical protein
MSTTEIESQLRAMTQEERFRVAELLDFIIHENDPEYQAEISRRIERMNRGEVVTAEELMAAHQRLIAEGR